MSISKEKWPKFVLGHIYQYNWLKTEENDQFWPFCLMNGFLKMKLGIYKEKFWPGGVCTCITGVTKVSFRV